MIDFPANPTVGQTFTAGGATWTWDGVKWTFGGTTGGPPVTVSPIAPSNPVLGALWWDSVGGQLYVWYQDANSSQWISASNSGGAASGGASISVGVTPPANPAVGALWWDANGGQLFVWYNDGNSSQWVPTTNQMGAIPVAATAPPLMDGTAAPGSSATYARGDHVHPTDASLLPLAGGTMTGGLIVPAFQVNSIAGSGTPSAFNGPSTSYRGMTGLTNGALRWSFYLGDNAAESGSNAGSNFSLNCYNDAGAFLNSPITIPRATGRVTMANGLTLSTGSLSVTNAGSGFQVGGGSIGVVNNVAGCNVSVSGGVFESSAQALWANKIGGNGSAMVIGQGGTACGSITVANATSTAYNTSSDVRLKRDEQSFDAGPILDALQVYDFEWTNAPGIRAYGVMAQEANEVFPDAVHHNENDDTWGVDYSKFVPLLLNEIKALRARIAALEAAQ